MMAFVEFAGPFRARPKLERVGALWRFIWLWFSVGVIRAGFNDLLREIRADVKQQPSSRYTAEMKINGARRRVENPGNAGHSSRKREESRRGVGPTNIEGHNQRGS